MEILVDLLITHLWEGESLEYCLQGFRTVYDEQLKWLDDNKIPYEIVTANANEYYVVQDGDASSLMTKHNLYFRMSEQDAAFYRLRFI